MNGCKDKQTKHKVKEGTLKLCFHTKRMECVCVCVQMEKAKAKKECNDVCSHSFILNSNSALGFIAN